MNVLKRMALCILAAGSLSGAPTLWAAPVEDDQTVVIGLGIVGVHGFSQGDDIRDSAFTSDLSWAGMSQGYLEWYPVDRVGFGLRAVLIGITEKAAATSGSGTTKTTTQLTVLNNFLTMTGLPYISDSGYARIGILAGFGTSDYKVEQKVDSGPVSKVSTSGPAGLAQVYIDWGGDAFGARFGIGALMTKLKDAEVKGAPGTKLTADASGSHAFFDLRWAF